MRNGPFHGWWLLFLLGMAATPAWGQPQAMPQPPNADHLPPYALVRQPAVKLPAHAVISALTFLDAAGNTLATGTSSGEITLWDIQQRKPQRILKGHEAGVKCLAVSPQGQMLVSAGWDDTVRVWDLRTGATLHVLRGHKRGISAVAFHPQGQLVASGSADQTIRLWDVRTGQATGVLEGHQGQVTGVAFTPDGQAIASSSTDGSVRLWEIPSGKFLRSLMQSQWRREWVHDLAFAPSGDLLAAAYSDGRIILWDWRQGRDKRAWQAHQQAAYSVAFSLDGKSLASAGFDETVRLWETNTGQERLRFHGHAEQVRNVVVADRGPWAASGGNDGQLLIWNLTPPRHPSPGERSSGLVEQHWNDLASGQAALAYRAVWQLSALGAGAVELIRTQVKPVPTVVVTKSIPQLIADLDNTQFLIREQAAQDLSRLGEPAREALRRELKRHPPSTEVRRRLEGLLLHLENSAVAPEELRALRALEVLERIGTPEARQVLAVLASGSAVAPLTQEARAALLRLEVLEKPTPGSGGTP